MKHAPVRLSAQAQACLQGYAWPGNVRELDNALQRALILQQGGVIEVADFCLAGAIPLSAGNEPLPTAAAEASGLGDDMRRQYQMIIDTLRAERGRRKEAAERLGISPRTLRYKLAQMRDAGLTSRPACSADRPSSNARRGLCGAGAPAKNPTRCMAPAAPVASPHGDRIRADRCLPQGMQRL